MFGRISPKQEDSSIPRSNISPIKNYYSPSSRSSPRSNNKNNTINKNSNPLLYGDLIETPHQKALSSMAHGGGTQPGPGAYDLPPPGWFKRNTRGAIITRPRDGPYTERDLLLSNGTPIRNILPAPESFTKPPPRSVSPVLLQTAERRKAFQKRMKKEQEDAAALRLASKGSSSSSPPKTSSSSARSRRCDIGLMNREMGLRPGLGPGVYSVVDSYSNSKNNGAYRHGIVFSSCPRILPVSKDADRSRSNSPENNNKGNSSRSRSQSPDGGAAISKTASSSKLPYNINGTHNNNYYQLKKLRKQHQESVVTESNAGSNNKGSPSKKFQKTSLQQSTFGYAPRLLDMNVVNPFLKGPELAPPVGAYNLEATNPTARGGSKRINNIPTLYRRDRAINLERKTDAPGPAVYESARSTDIWKPVI